MIKNWLAPGIIVLLTCLFLVFWDSPPDTFLTPAPQPPSQSEHATNIMHNAVSRRYDEHGQLSSVFIVKESHYYQIDHRRPTASDYADMTEPKLTLHSADSPPWTIIADTGKASDNGNLIQLWDNVQLWQINAQGQKSELTTPYLVVKPEQQYAETDKPVKIVSPGNTTNAVGMKAYLQTDTIHLLSNVRSIHEPQ
jgi:lipopolysaccharide export system protein LptC